MSRLKRYNSHGFIYIFGKETVFCDDTLREQDMRQILEQTLLDDGYDIIRFYDIDGALRYPESEEQKMNELYSRITGAQNAAEPQKANPSKRQRHGDLGANGAHERPSETPHTETTVVNTRHRDVLKIFDAILDHTRRPAGLEKIKTAVVIMNMMNWLDQHNWGDDIQDLNNFLARNLNRRVDYDDLIIFYFNFGNPHDAYRECESRGFEPIKYLTEWREYAAPEGKGDLDKCPNIILVPPPSKAEVRNRLNRQRILGDIELKPSKLDELNETVFREIRKSSYNLGDAKLADLMVKKPGKTSKEMLDEMVGLDAIRQPLAGIEKQVRDANLDKGIPAWRSRFDEAGTEDAKKKNLKLHFVLQGNPGTGKTTVAKILGRYLYEIGALSSGHVVKCITDNLIAGYVGQTAIKTDEQVQNALGGVLFIDEISGIVASEFRKEVTSVLLNAMTSFPDLSVIIAGYQEDIDAFIAIDPGLGRRFLNVIELPDYTGPELAEIFRRMALKANYTIAPELESILVDFMNNWLKQKPNKGWGNAGLVENFMDAISRSIDSDHVVKIKDIPAEMKVKTGDKTVVYDLAKCLLVGVDAPSPTEKLDALIGLGNVKKTIEKKKARIKHDQSLGKRDVNSKNFLFLGNPGTGKTTVARLMGEILAGIGALDTSNIVEIESAADLVDRHQGENRAKKEFERALGGVLFIDEAYSLLKESGGQAVINTLTSFSENNSGKLCIILAGYRDDMEELLKANQGLNSRFTERIEFDNYSSDELVKVFDLFCAKGNYAYNEEFCKMLREYAVLLSKQASRKGFGNAREMRKLFDKCIDELALRTDGTDMVKNLLIADDIRAVIGGNGVQKDGKTARDKLNDLIGLEGAKKKIEELTARIEMDKRRSKTSKPPLNFLFTGNPGTGKTTIARLFGEILHDIGVLPSSEVDEIKSRSDLVAGFIGQTEEKVKERFNSALGKVLFIDEAYKFAPTDERDFGKQVIDELVTFSENNLGDVCIILAGYPDNMQHFLQQNKGLSSRFPMSDAIHCEDYSDADLFLIFKHISGSEQEGFHCQPEFDALLKQCIPVIRKSIKPKDFGNAREMRILFDACKNAFSLRVRGQEDFVSEFTADDLRRAMQVKGLPLPGEQQAAKAATIPLPAKDLLAANSAAVTGYNKDLAEMALIRITTDKGAGSGFIITEDGYALTCDHVIHEGNNIKARVRIKNVLGGFQDTLYDCTVVYTNPKIDIAVIKLDSGKVKLPYVSLLPEASKPLPTETEVTLFGYPFGTRYDNHNIFKGFIASYQTQDGVEKMMLNSEGKSGNSGGLVIDPASGYAAGVFRGSDIESGKITEEINYAMPVRYVWEILSEKKKSETAAVEKAAQEKKQASDGQGTHESIKDITNALSDADSPQPGGVPEKPFTAYRGDKPYIFISYSHADLERVFPIIHDFHNNGFPVWYDEGIEAGEDWRKQIALALLNCSLFVVFISTSSVNSENVKNEVFMAEKKQKSFLPIYLDDIELPIDLELSIGRKQFIPHFKMDAESFYSKCFHAFDAAGITKLSEEDLREDTRGLNINTPRGEGEDK